MAAGFGEEHDLTVAGEVHAKALARDLHDPRAAPELLDAPDQDVYTWLIGTAQPPAEFSTPVLERLRAFKSSLPIASGDLSGS